MATPTVRSTYVMDVDTMQALERIARRWRVSKSEALRRAIRAAAASSSSSGPPALRALDELQRSLRLTPARARAWASRARAERRAASARSETRGL
jgi:hypothetical protein